MEAQFLPPRFTGSLASCRFGLMVDDLRLEFDEGPIRPLPAIYSLACVQRQGARHPADERGSRSAQHELRSGQARGLYHAGHDPEAGRCAAPEQAREAVSRRNTNYEMHRGIEPPR